MATTDERVEQMRYTSEALAVSIRGHCADALACRPAEGAWCATEIISHLRDIEESYLERVRFILTNDDPALVVFDPERWAEERQYRRHDCVVALHGFCVRRQETLSLLAALSVDAWERAGFHPLRGRLTVRHIVHGWAKHDAEHLHQLRRALSGRP